MASVRDNMAEVRLELERFRRVGKLDGPGRYKRTLGEDVPDLISEGLYERYVLAQQQPGGQPLAKLAPSTLRRKRRKGYPDTIGVEKGLMLSREQLRGTVEVTPNDLSMTYGTTELAKQEIEWFTEGNEGQNRPSRPGFELDARIEAGLDRLYEESCDKAVDALNGSNP